MENTTQAKKNPFIELGKQYAISTGCKKENFISNPTNVKRDRAANTSSYSFTLTLLPTQIFIISETYFHCLQITRQIENFIILDDTRLR